MGNSSTACTEVSFANATDPAQEESVTSSSYGSAVTSEDEAATSPEAMRFNRMDLLTATPPAIVSWAPVHESRAQRHAAALSEAQMCSEEAAMLDERLDGEAEEERDLRRAERELKAELNAMEDESVHETDLQEVLLAEIAERDSYSFKLHRWSLDAEELRSNAAGDVANLRADIHKLRSEMAWAERYREGVAANRSLLESEVLDAERCLQDRRRNLETSGIGTSLRGYDLAREEKAEQTMESMEATVAGRWSEAVMRLQLQRSELQIQLMREEHQKQSLANDLNQLQTGIGKQTELREMVLFT